jgi:hypothetical protein
MRGLTLAMVIGTVACGGDDGGSGVGIDQLAGRLAEVQCAQMTRCCEPGEIPFGIPSEGPACVETWTEILEEEADIVDMRAAIAAGRLELDGAQAVRCLAHIEALSCADFSAFMQEEQAATGRECLDMLVGKVALGGACDESYECTSGLCDQGQDPPRCAAAIPAGGACAPSCEDRFECRQCEGALLCDTTSMTCTADPVIVPSSRCNGR